MLDDIFPSRNISTREFLKLHSGRYILLNVSYRGAGTPACVNITKTGSAAWRSGQDRTALPLSLQDPPFEFTSDTIYLPYKVVNTLGTYFQTIRDIIPTSAFNDSNRASIGTMSRGSDSMGRTLISLQDKSSELRDICAALERSINTPIYSLRRTTKKPVFLANDQCLSEHGNVVLQAFVNSLPIYDELPELCGFGTENAGRKKQKPNKRDALLRHFMQAHPANPLGGTFEVDFVAHELKPLNIADRLNWNCVGNPRTDSIDLLLKYRQHPVITEVKMSGDSFLSVAVSQMLYYAAYFLVPVSQSDSLVGIPALVKGSRGSL